MESEWAKNSIILSLLRGERMVLNEDGSISTQKEPPRFLRGIGQFFQSRFVAEQKAHQKSENLFIALVYAVAGSGVEFCELHEKHCMLFPEDEKSTASSDREKRMKKAFVLVWQAKKLGQLSFSEEEKEKMLHRVEHFLLNTPGLENMSWKEVRAIAQKMTVYACTGCTVKEWEGYCCFRKSQFDY